MIKSKFGPITNPKTGMSKDIVINALSKESLKDILIGGGIVMVGITYLALSTFKMEQGLLKRRSMKHWNRLICLLINGQRQTSFKNQFKD